MYRISIFTKEQCRLEADWQVRGMAVAGQERAGRHAYFAKKIGTYILVN